jgi:hypothetical protein
MKICFVQSVLEINLIKKKLGFLPVIVPLSLETQVHCDLEKINYLDPENYIDKDFFRKASLECSESIKKIDFSKIKFYFIKNELTSLIRFRYNQIVFLIELVRNIKKKFKVSKIFLTNEYSAPEYDVMLIYPGNNFSNIENIFVKLFSDNIVEILKTRENKKKNFNFGFNYDIIGANKNKKKKILLSNSSYNFKRIIFYLLRNGYSVSFFNEGISFFKKIIFKLLGVEIIEFKKIGKYRLINSYDLKFSFKFNQFDISQLIQSQIDKSVQYLSNLEKKYEAIKKYFDVSNIQLVITNTNRDIGSMLVENAKKKKIKSLMISHGTISAGFDEVDQIYKKTIAEGVFSGQADFYAIQSKITLDALKSHELKGKPLITGNLIFAEKKSIPKKKETKCLYAVTSKPFSAMQLFGLEMYHEFFNNLKDLENFAQKNNYKFYIHLHPGAKNSLHLLKKKFNMLNFTIGKIENSLKNATVTLSFSSTTIEDSLNSEIPVILFDTKRRYKHCKSESDPFKKNQSVYYVNNFENLKNCIETIKNSSQINFDNHIFLDKSKKNIAKLFHNLIN